MKIDIKIDDRDVIETLSNLQDAVDDLTPAMRDIAGVLADAAEQSFENEADPVTGEPWFDLADETKRARAKKGKWPGKILQVSGQLAASIQSESGQDFSVVGTNKIYAPTHQFGDEDRNIPTRPFLGISDDDRDEIIEIIQKHLSVS